MKSSVCCFCNGKDLTLLYTTQYHPVKRDHGPFNFYVCDNCRSGLTLPLPSPTQLKELYESFDGGMDEATRKNRDSNPLDAWYQQCIERAIKHLPSEINSQSHFTWIDIGAGKGELAKLMANQYPHSKGLAIDFHSQPPSLKNIPNLDWLQCDLNDPFFSHKLEGQKFDLTFSITVLEHVREPFDFLVNIIPLLEKSAVFYLTVPDYSSRAARLLKTKWPYYIPGEHINIPSKKGLELLLSRLLKGDIVSNESVDTFVNRIILPYPIAYYLQYFGLIYFAKLLRGRGWTMRLPTGMLEAVVKPITAERVSHFSAMVSKEA